MSGPAGGRLDLRVGDLIEVRGPEEILATLDENGELDSLPFMPEMLRYCGRRLTVYKVAHKLCDTQTRTGMRRMTDAVHLSAAPPAAAESTRASGRIREDRGARCDGSAHGGCQAACLLYWKTAWLRKVDPVEPAALPALTGAEPGRAEPAAADAARLPPLLTAATRRPPAADGAPVYRCQATELLRAAPRALPLRDLGQFMRDVRTGNVGPLFALRAFLVAVYNRVQGASARVLPRRLRFRGGRPWGFLRGTAAHTPTGRSDLRPGDLVRIRSRREIAATLNADLLNRGLGFDNEMARSCGQTARVLRRVDHIIDERTGRMLNMRHPCIVLENVVCAGAYNLNCPRAITPYWREIWLDRIETAHRSDSVEGEHTPGASALQAAE